MADDALCGSGLILAYGLLLKEREDLRHTQDSRDEERPMQVKVLIADDSIFIRDMIRHHLEHFGCKVVAEAENGAQAVALFKTMKPDLVTLDVVMAHVDGIDALTAFRMIKKENPQVPILIVSAVPFEKTREAFMGEGALDYVIKPFNKYYFEQVRRKLERIFPSLAQYAPGAESETRARRE